MPFPEPSYSFLSPFEAGRIFWVEGGVVLGTLPNHLVSRILLVVLLDSEDETEEGENWLFFPSLFTVYQ